MFEMERLSSKMPELSLHRVVVVTSIFIVIYGGSTVAGNAARGYQLAQQTQQLQQSLAREQAEYAQLDALRRYMRTDAFVESQAREEGLGRAGDTAILVAAPTATAGPSQRTAGSPWWERYFGH